jgi:hypothetical protein
MKSVSHDLEAREDHTLADRLSSAFTLFAALVAGAFCVTAAMYGIGWLWLTPEFERSHLAMQNEGAALAAMLDQETSLRQSSGD